MIETVLIIIILLAVSDIVGGVIWQEVRNDRKQDAQARAYSDALIERYIVDKYPATMTEDEIKEMNAGRWE